MRKLIVGLFVTLSLTAALDARARRTRLESHWRDRDVVVDGADGEWAGPLVPFDEKQPITAAAVNDGQFLYVVLTTSEPGMRMRMLRQGLIVWFDPAGGDKKHFGIKYPVGVPYEDGPGTGGRGRRRRGAGQGQDRPRGGDDPDSGGQRDRLEPPNRLEVLGASKDDMRSYTADMAPGIAVKAGETEGSFVYELKVPLARTADIPYAIDAKAGATIGIGLEMPKMEMPSREGRGGFGGGGIGGGRGGRGGGMGRGSGSGRPGGVARAKPLKAWATLQLAAK